jgi:hypothetical protein
MCVNHVSDEWLKPEQVISEDDDDDYDSLMFC